MARLWARIGAIGRCPATVSCGVRDRGDTGVVAHAIDDAAVAFYERHGFFRSPLGERIMLLPIETVRSLVGKS